jgi:phage shock protein PspC (stress-responsive transcriptional regulator)
MEKEKLYRLKSIALVGGVCSGFAEYLDIDVSLLRLMFIFLVVASGGIMFIFYPISWIIIPTKIDVYDKKYRKEKKSKQE